MEHPERLENAFVSHFAALTWPSSMLNSAGVARVFAGEDDEERDGQYIACYINGDMSSEEPQFSNNRWAEFVVSVHSPAHRDDTEDALDAHKTVAAALENAMLDDALESSLSNSGLLVYRVIDRTPVREQSETGWISGYRFKVYSCLLN
jgi:hypothetical protein